MAVKSADWRYNQAGKEYDNKKVRVRQTRRARSRRLTKRVVVQYNRSESRFRRMHIIGRLYLWRRGFGLTHFCFFIWVAVVEDSFSWCSCCMYFYRSVGLKVTPIQYAIKRQRKLAVDWSNGDVGEAVGFLYFYHYRNDTRVAR